MRLVIQRSGSSKVAIDGKVTGAIGSGLCVLLCAGEGDGKRDAEVLAKKTAELRIFTDDGGKMNLSLLDLMERGDDVGVLAISQFTLYADCRKGRRPSFVRAAQPQIAQDLYEHYMLQLEQLGVNVARGRFGADMKVEITNDGPVTIILDSEELTRGA